jgi:pimeloyl-ACP methyl ester carboxylesterase
MIERTVRTRMLDCAYIERGPANGKPLFLVHGFPDDARTWDVVAEALAGDGYRTIAPYVRGFGATRLLPGAARTGEIAALARDVLDLADALGIDTFDYVGHDWGARAGYAIAALSPKRLASITALAVAYGTNVAAQSLSVEQLRAYWYQWYFATPRGEDALRRDRRTFCRDLWRTWSPHWRFEEATYAATAASFDNPDFVEIAVHSYRQRWGFAPGDPALASDRAFLDAVPPIAVKTLVLMGRDDGATLPDSILGKERFFVGPYTVSVVDHSGHFLAREQPAAVTTAVRRFLTTN